MALGNANSDEWRAQLIEQPPAPDELQVAGNVMVPNPSVEPSLVLKEPQGFNPQILLLELQFSRPDVSGDNMDIQVLTPKEVLFVKTIEPGGTKYTEVDVLSNGNSIAKIEVQIIKKN